MKTRSLLFTDVGDVSLADVEIPEPGPGEIRVATRFSAISPGTERRCLAGKQAGAPAFPFVPGYSQAGVVDEVGPGVEIVVGTRVFCGGTKKVLGANRLWGGHIANAIALSSEIVMLPDSLSLADASLARLVAIAYHGVRLSRPLPHERVAVVGLGPIGLLSARLHALAGCLVVGIDPLKSRGECLEASGGLWAPTIDDARAFLSGGAQIVVDATGVASVFTKAISLGCQSAWGDFGDPGPRVLVQGSYPGEFAVHYDDAFSREATILVPRDCQPRDLRFAVDLLARKKLVVDDLYSVHAPDDCAAVYATLGSPSTKLTALFDWSPAGFG